MTEDKVKYYYKMREKNRLIPICMDGHLIAIITYYIGSIIDRYVRDDPWSIIDDEPDGTICFIDQLISNKDNTNHQYSFHVLREFKQFIKTKFPRVRVIRWNRYKNGVSNVYYCTIAK